MTEMLKKPVKPYKSKTGQWLTGSLFYERMNLRPDWQKEYDPIFTLDDRSPDYISARDTFIELMDPTGYKWAIKYLGEWAHFLKLMEAPWFSKRVALWREEIETKLEAEAVAAIRNIATNPEDKNQLTAAKFLHSLASKKPTAAKRGRPTKEEVYGAIKQEVAARDEFAEDAERLGLTVINGGKI